MIRTAPPSPMVGFDPTSCTSPEVGAAATCPARVKGIEEKILKKRKEPAGREPEDGWVSSPPPDLNRCRC